MVDKEVQELVAKWRAIEAMVGQAEYEIAAYTVLIEKRASHKTVVNEVEVKAFFWETLGVRNGTRIRTFRRMAAVVRRVTSAEVWRAVGWAGVREVSKIGSARRRNVVCARLVDRHGGKGKVRIGVHAVSTIIAEVAPEACVPKSALETKKDREQEKLANARSRETKSRTSEDAADLATLRAFFKRLVANGYAFLIDQATDDERKALKLKRAPKARAG